MSIGKYITSPAVIGASLGAIGTAKKAGSVPNDWRRIVIWGVWAAGLALAIASVAMHDRDEDFQANRTNK